jgi:hypothetical protein
VAPGARDGERLSAVWSARGCREGGRSVAAGGVDGARLPTGGSTASGRRWGDRRTTVRGGNGALPPEVAEGRIPLGQGRRSAVEEIGDRRPSATAAGKSVDRGEKITEIGG